ncbi:MAG: hypothetical protein MZV63_31880 [Marinilabiliales bacterium]|nr:hypothetical protein [Marinilabiliales bacterium]
MQVLFNVVKEGRLTPSLSDLKRGDALWTSAGFGGLPVLGKAWWIAQGTGIAPFVSMFRSGQMENKVLVHGGRDADSFYYSDEFLPVLGDQYIRCSSREQAPGLFHGRVTDYLRSVPELPADAKVLSLRKFGDGCGDARYFDFTGISFRNIVGEIYFRNKHLVWKRLVKTGYLV